MIKKYQEFLKEWLDSPGSIDVPGQNTEIRVNSRNYKPENQPLPQVIDAMYEASYINEFLDNQGKSEEFNKFLEEDKRRGSDITEYLKENFKKETGKKS